MRKLIILLPIASAIWFVSAIWLGGINYPSYDHMSQFISELGATGAPNGEIVSLFGFIPTSILLTAFVILAIYSSSKRTAQVIGLTGIGVYSITLSIAAIYPCDVGCRPVDPSTSQFVHDLSAIFGYLSGIVGVYLLASDTKKNGSKRLGTIGFVLGGLTLITFFLLEPEFQFVGLAQRIFELSMYSWIILYAFNLRAEIFYKINAIKK